jgi:hypothetical protein
MLGKAAPDVNGANLLSQAEASIHRVISPTIVERV